MQEGAGELWEAEGVGVVGGGAPCLKGPTGGGGVACAAGGVAVEKADSGEPTDFGARAECAGGELAKVMEGS